MKDLRLLGFNIQNSCLDKNISEHQLSKILGCNINDIFKMYYGLAIPSWDQLTKISDIVGVSVEDLLMQNEEKYYHNKIRGYEIINKDSIDEVLDIMENYIRLCDAVNN